MLPSDSAHARRLGGRLGTLAWLATAAALRATATGLRVAFVVTFSSWIWHAIVPGMAFGAWVVIFLAAYVVGLPVKAVGRGFRRAAAAGRRWWLRRARARALADLRSGRAYTSRL